MTFVRALCTEQLFELLQLPASLKASDRLNPIGHDLIHDSAACSALIPHPFHYADYPDRALAFYLRGRHFMAWEYMQRSDGPDRVEVTIGEDVDDATCDEISGLLDSAVAVLRDEARYSLPIVLNRKKPPQVRKPRSVPELISKLNTFCEDISRLQFVPNMEELAIQTVISTVLLPEELLLLEQHLHACGWNALSMEAQDLIKKVLSRMHQQNRPA